MEEAEIRVMDDKVHGDVQSGSMPFGGAGISHMRENM